ncbi:MAG: hypothetical protein AAGC86_04905 [Pseudomonadota bacterium]
MFDEICTHLEILLRRAEVRFGHLDPEATDLIVSFGELRREIKRQLMTATGAEPTSQAGAADASTV